MTKIEALKELLKENIYELNRNTHIDGLSIEFKGDEFIVLDKDKNVIFKDLLKNYDLDFDSQKRFILKVANSVTSFVDVLEDIEDKKSYFEDLIKNYFDVIGSGDIYKTDTYISVNTNELYKEYEKNKGCNDCWNEYINVAIDYFIKNIKSKFENKGVRVVLYYDNNMFNVGFYVSAVRYEDETYISFIEDLEDLETSNNIDELVSYDSITLYYSLMEDEKEADKAVEFIKELVA